MNISQQEKQNISGGDLSSVDASPISAVAIVFFHWLQLQIRGGNVSFLATACCVFLFPRGTPAGHDTGGVV